MPRKRNRDNLREEFATFTPVMFQRGLVVHALTMYAPKHTACGKRSARMNVHFSRVIDCIDCLAALFYRVPVEDMKAWLDRHKFRAPVAAMKAASKRGGKR
jgi:hypothetical protein